MQSVLHLRRLSNEYGVRTVLPVIPCRPRDASSSYPSPVGTPSAHVSPQLAPIHKQGRLPTGSSLWSGNTNLPSPSTSPISQASQGKHHGVYVRQPVALDACETTVTFAVTPQNKVR